MQALVFLALKPTMYSKSNLLSCLREMVTSLPSTVIKLTVVSSIEITSAVISLPFRFFQTRISATDTKVLEKSEANTKTSERINMFFNKNMQYELSYKYSFHNEYIIQKIILK